jgi:hypothetical protein
MADLATAPPEENDELQLQSPRLTPLQFPQGFVPGRYAPWYCSDEDCYGPDELGEYQNAIDEIIQNVTKCDAAARIWEVLQAWEMRLFRRNYHFLNAGWKGWGMFGGSSGTTGQSIMQTQNSMKLFSCNVFGSRHKKITALLSRELPPMEVDAKEEEDPIDEAAAEEAEKYLQAFLNSSCLKQACREIAGLFCTDGRAGLLTYTVADQTEWGTETPSRAQQTYGMEEPDGITPETEMEPGDTSEKPARREVAIVGGKLEWKVPLLANNQGEMGWARYQHEVSVNMLKAKYPWVRDKIATQGNVGGMDQIDRMARINVRLAVQASSSSGEAYKNDATETATFIRPSEYESIADEGMRAIFYETFPDGMEIWHAGGQLAMVRNCRMSDHVKIVHATTGDGQNREAVLTNYLPLQKILNANISLVDRYFRSGVPRRFVGEPYVDSQQMNSQSNDPAKATPVYMDKLAQGVKLSDITAVENVPQLNTAILEFVQWLIQGGPEAMDGGSPAAFGEAENSTQDQGVYQTTRLRRDQALQVFSMPWDAICEAFEAVCQQAIESAAKNREADISESIPGQKRLKVEIGKLQGNVVVRCSNRDIPKTMAEEEERMGELLAQSSQVALFQQIMMDPRNLQVFQKFPTLRRLNVPGADAVEQQQGEFEILLRSGPVPNPQLQQIEQQLQTAPQTPETMPMVEQLQQMAQSMPPLVSTVPVAQDNSENHVVHAAVTLGFLASPTGRKLKNGTDEQKQIYQNFLLHWQEHMTVLKQLQPPPQIEMKATVTVDPTKLPPDAQAKAFQALGLQVTPAEVTPQQQTHEITQEKEGVDAQGVPVKQKVSVVGKPLG